MPGGLGAVDATNAAPALTRSRWSCAPRPGDVAVLLRPEPIDPHGRPPLYWLRRALKWLGRREGFTAVGYHEYPARPPAPPSPPDDTGHR